MIAFVYIYRFPQSVGIAGGRPSSSYYFVGSQADNLFYLDPHNVRPTIPLRPPPVDVGDNTDISIHANEERWVLYRIRNGNIRFTIRMQITKTLYKICRLCTSYDQIYIGTLYIQF